MNAKKTLVIILVACIMLPGITLARDSHGESGNDDQDEHTHVSVSPAVTGTAHSIAGTATYQPRHQNETDSDDDESVDSSEDRQGNNQDENKTEEQDDDKNLPLNRGSPVNSDEDEKLDHLNDGNRTRDHDRNVTGSPTTIPTLNIGAPVTTDYDARIAALEEQVAEQNRELERQGTLLDQILGFLKNILGWE